MDVRDLTGEERGVLMAMLAHVAEGDERISPAEVLELKAIAEDLGVDDLQAELMRARAVVQTRDDLKEAARKVERGDAQELIRTLLMDLAQADGERSAEELEIVADITSVWVRS